MEGDGEGMVAIVHGLGDAGLSVTLTGAQCKGPSDRKDHPQYEYRQRHYNRPEYTQTYYNQREYSQPRYNQREYSQPRYNQREYSQPRYNQQVYSQREAKNHSEYKQRDHNKQRRHVKLFGVTNWNLRPHHTTTAAVQTHSLGVHRVKESALIQDDIYTSSYQVAHCRAHPTVSAAHASEFPLQRISPYTNQDHFMVGGFGSGSGERGAGGSMRVQNAQSHRSNVTWPDRSSSLYCARTPRGTDAFAESLRKYPSFSPERTPSADLIQRLLSYTQARNLAKGHSRSMRCLKRTSRELNKENQPHVRKFTNNIQTYARKKNEPTYDAKVDVKKNLHSPSSESRHKDSNLDSTYDYLKCRSRFSGTEVRYFNDMSKFLKETIRHIIENQPSSAMSVDAEGQSSPRTSREACTTAPFGTKGSNITLTPGPKMCCNCHRPLPCNCDQPCSSSRKLRFHTSNLVRINQIVCPDDDCPDDEPCSCPELSPGDKIKEQIIKWLKDIPLKANFTIEDKNKRDKMIRNLTDYLVHIKHDDDFELNAREIILKNLNNLPIWYPCETDTDNFRNELAGNLIKKLLDLFNIQGESSKHRGTKDIEDTFKQELIDWLEDIPELTSRNASERKDNEKLAKYYANFLNTLLKIDNNIEEVRSQVKKAVKDLLDKALVMKNCKLDTITRDKYTNGILRRLSSTIRRVKDNDDLDLLEQMTEEVKDSADTIPELYGEDLIENNKMIKKLAQNIQKRRADASRYSEKEIQKIIQDWEQNRVKRKGGKIDAQRLENLENELIGKIDEMKELSLSKQYSLKELTQDIQEWVETFSELVAKREVEKKEIVEKFAVQIRNFKDRGYSDEQIQKEMPTWVKYEVEKKGAKIDAQKLENLENELSDKINPKNELVDGLADEIQDWVDTIPELAGGNIAENKEVIINLARRIKKFKKEGTSNKEIQKEIKNWIKDEVEKKGGKIDAKRLDNLGNQLIDKIEQKQAIGDLSDEIVEWFEFIPELAGEDKAENKKIVNELAKIIQKLKVDGFSEKEIKKEIKNLIKNEAEHKGGKIDARRLENLGKQLVDKMGGAEKDVDELVDEIQEWFKTIPELSGSKEIHDKKIINMLARKIRKLKVDGHNKKEIQKEIKKWVKGDVNKNDGKIDARRLDILCDRLLGKMDLKQDINLGDNIREWFEAISELDGEDLSKNKEMDSKLAKRIQKLKADGKSEKEIQNDIKNWIKDEVEKKGGKIDDKRLEIFENQLANKIELEKDLDNLGNEIQEWFETIPELAEDDKAENKKNANKLAKIIQTLKADGFSEKEIQKDIKSWIKYEIGQKGGKIDDKRLEILINQLVDKMARSEESIEVIANNVQEWIETIPELASGDEAENKKMVNKLARNIQKLKVDGFSEKEIQKEIKNWVKGEVEKKGGKIDAVKLDNLGNKLAGKIESKEALVDLCNDIQEWFKTIKEQTGDNTENKKMANILAKRVQQLTNEGYSEKEIQKEIKNWVKEEVEKKGGKIDSKRLDKIGNELVRKVQRNLEILKKKSSLKKRKRWSKQSGHELSLDDGQKASHDRRQFSSSTDRSTRSNSSNSRDSTGTERGSTNRSLMRKGWSEATTQHPLRKLEKDTQKSEQKGSDRKQYNDLKDNAHKVYYVDNKSSDARKSSVTPEDRKTRKRKKEIENLFDDETLSEASKNLNKDTQRKIYEELAKNIDELLSPESDKVYQKILNILKEQTGLPDDEIVPLARTIFLKAKEIAMSKSDDDDDDWVTENFGDILDEFGVTVNRKDIEANLLDFLPNQLRRGDLDDETKGVFISILQKANLPHNDTEELANTLNKRVKELAVEGNRGPSTSTPRQSQKASGTEDFYPRRNTDDSLMSSIHDTGSNKANEQRHKNQLEDIIRDWVNSLDAIDDENVKENMVKDIAQDIVDRKKYLQLNPDSKDSKEDELENLKYQVFRWLNRVGVEDLTPFVSNISSLMNSINNVEVPEIGIRKNLDSLTNKIGSWLEQKPRNDFISDEKCFPRKMAKVLAIKLQPLIDKPNSGQSIDNEIAQWLLKVFTDVSNLNLLSGELKGLLMKGDGRYKTNQKFKTPADILYDLVYNWCQELPIYGGDTPEEQEKVNTLKQNLASKIINKIGELNMNPETFNDDFLYEDLLKDEVDTLLSTVPKNPELEKYLPALKRDFVSKVKEAKHKISDELAGQTYRQQLRDNISKSTHLTENLSSEDQASFEILKDNLADAFIDLHYVMDNVEDRNNVKQKIGNEINRFCNDYLRRHPASPIDPCKLNQEMHKALQKVTIPRDESMRNEVEQIRIKDVINEWINELPLKYETIAEQLHKNKMISLLSKTLHEIEKVKENNPDLDSDAAMLDEISKFLKKLPLIRGQECNIPEFANSLKNKLKNTEDSRRFNLSSSFCPKACPGLPPPSYAPTIPPCSISQEDRDHLCKIRKRNMTKKPKTSCYKDAYTNPCWVDTGSQNDLEVSCWESYHTRNRPGTVCPGMSQTSSPIHPGSYLSMRGYSQRHSPCSQSVQHGYGWPQVIVKEYFWDANDTSKNQDPDLQNFQGIQSSVPQGNQPGSPHQNAGVARENQPGPSCVSPLDMSPKQCQRSPQPLNHQFLTSYSSAYNNNHNNHISPRVSTSSAIRHPDICYCPQDPPGEDEVSCPYRSAIRSERQTRCRSPEMSSNEEQCPEGAGPSKKPRVVRLGSLDGIESSPKVDKKQSSKKVSRDDESDWSSIKFPEDMSFWNNCSRHRIYVSPSEHEPFLKERERREEKVKCRCKERVLTTCRGRKKRSCKEICPFCHDDPSVKCSKCFGIYCPRPSFLYFRR